MNQLFPFGRPDGGGRIDQTPELAREASGGAKLPAPDPSKLPAGLHVKDGLLWIGHDCLGVHQADDVANAAGYLYAERLIYALQDNPPSGTEALK